MGFFDFLHPKPVAPQTVAFSNLGPWLTQFLEAKKLDQKLEAFNQQVQESLKQLKNALPPLQNASPPNVSEEEQRILQENQERYLEKTQFFLDTLHLPQTVSDLGYFTSQLSQDLEQLQKSLEQNQYVLQQYLPQPLATVTQTLKNLADQNNSFRKKLEQEHLEDIRDLRLLLKQYQSDQDRKQQIQQQIKDREEPLSPLRQREQKIAQRLQQYQQSPAQQEYQTLQQEKTKLGEELGKEQEELHQAFLQLTHALRKYHYEAKEPLVQQYIDDAGKALQEDGELRIVNLLQQLREQLENLDLKEDKEVQALNTLGALTPTYFQEKQKKLIELNEPLNSVKAQMANSVIALNIMEQESLLTETRARMQEHQEELQELRQKLEDIHEETHKHKIHELLPKLNVVLEE
ncbi:MAG TPA: hypothetical protein VJG90_05785 [Candidatus Nanoarchaeia archaeon]|nr:hypothetical protein [Candidatus Nanoarchaeia archaeon]